MNPIDALRSQAREFEYRMLESDCAVEGYRMSYDVSAQILAVYDAAGTVVAGITHRRIFVLPDHRGQALGAEVLIRAFETGVMHPDTMNQNNPLTTAGRANRSAAHRIAVERAVKAGIEVSPDVLADYADWMPTWTSVAEARSPGP